jgi:hypothetical protein
MSATLSGTSHQGGKNNRRDGGCKFSSEANSNFRRSFETVFPEHRGTQGPRGTRLTADGHGSVPKQLIVSAQCRAMQSACIGHLE